MIDKISKSIKLKVAQRAKFCCEYCLFPEAFLATFFHVDHIRSLKHGGLTILYNLAYACPHCNQNKGSDVATFIGRSDESLVRFFNPRKDIWQEHFELYNGQILGKTQIGEATAFILGFNEPDKIIFRQALIDCKLFPH